ncbi:FxSxx-COOH system tetratricopeptide repeat protein [Actinoplanes sp. NPDC049681]|uniref:FxSxx-COOH system tetratricopeptide repeat protein n=1 Tax=Actinoplanes sp. NPDC049681 TaxID=3363905 RepID=UPI00379C02D3
MGKPGQVTVGDLTGRREQLFVSYAGADRAWAEWVAWQLREAGHEVELDVWSWPAGDNAVLRVSQAVEKADRVVALFSEAYFEVERFTTDEWSAVLTERHRAGRLVPLRLAEVIAPAVLRPLVYRDLFGLDEAQARRVVREALDGPRPPRRAPTFPATPSSPAASAVDRDRPPRFPAVGPAVCRLPVRTPAFVGRDGMIAELCEQLERSHTTVVQAVHGMGGVGKTSLVNEYAHRFASRYDLLWWIDAERPELITEQLSALAVAAGWVGPDAPAAAAAEAVTQQLRGRDRWLLVFDNVVRPADIHPWLVEGPGHLLITSRHPTWHHIDSSLPVDVFAREEATALLRRLLPTVSEREADRVAAALGDLPLALAQAAGLMATTGMTGDEYLAELETHAAELLAEAAPVSYPRSLAAALGVSVQKLAQVDEAAVQLAYLCAQLAPEPIPLTWWRTAPAGLLPAPLAQVAASALAWRRSLGRLAEVGLAHIDGHSVQLHRLTQAVLRDQRNTKQRHHDRACAEQLVAAAEPDDDGSDPNSWQAWAALVPHLLALDPPTAGPELRSTACNGLWYLLMRGEHHTLLPLAEAWHEHWQDILGPNDHHVLWAVNQLALAHRGFGNYRKARTLDEENLRRKRRAYGDDDANTLASASNLAANLGDLGEHEEARALNEDTLTRYRRVLGDDHPDTLCTASNLAIDLSRLGEHEQARALNEDTLTRYRRVLGDEHPDTLRTAANLAANLSDLGEHQRARALNEDTLTHRHRGLGDDHRDISH